MINRKFLFILLVFVSCSLHAIAQTDFYYYKGKKIPLNVNEDKVCVSIPKDNKKTSERIIANIRILSKIKDEDFDIFVISRSEYEKLTSLGSWKEDARSVIITPNYITTDKIEVFMTPYLNLKLKREEDIDLLTSCAEKYGFKIIKQVSLMPLWYILALTLDSDKNSLECANQLWESGKFAASVPDFWSDDLTCANDTSFYQQWGLYNSSHTDIDISACSAWNYATGRGIKIAIIDNGVDSTHIDLNFNMSHLSYDTETESSPSQLYLNQPVYGHGTHCAGIAAAIKDDTTYIAGVAPEATIISVSCNLEDTTTNSRIKRAKGITWAYQHGADIISNSWSSGTHHLAIDKAIYDAFTNGRQGKGCVIVFAAGNYAHNYISYPADCNDTILVVGSIDSSGNRSTYSNYGARLDLVAPGESILSTLPNNAIGYLSGTSMACPHVAGVAALVLQRNPDLTVSQVNSIICSNAKKISTVNFNESKPYGSWNNQYGYGLVDAYQAVINTHGTAYIQNETITGTRIISADNIYVGKDVTNTKPYGNVVLGQGNITLRGEYIKINNSTTVPLGTILTIDK